MNKPFWRGYWRGVATAVFALMLLMAFGFFSFAQAGEWSLSRETIAEELAWQSLNVADAISTQRAQVNGWEELGPWKVICGSHPSQGRIVQAAALWGAGHLAITLALEANDAPRWVRRTWQLVTITSTGLTVKRNLRLGVRR